ncbi:MAG: RluA family pseudouridine synthase [Kofleriaceae bacterium]
MAVDPAARTCDDLGARADGGAATEARDPPAGATGDELSGEDADWGGSSALADWWPPRGSHADGVDWGQTSHLDAAGRPRIVERRLAVPPELAGLRLDHFLKAQIPRLSRTKAQEVILTQLRRDGADGAARPLRPNTVVLAHERYTIARPARPEPPCPRTFSVLYEDDDLLVIDKPAGLPVHASAKFYFNTLTRVLLELRPDEDLQICHRLDRETSGALVVAKRKAAAVAVKGSFAHKRVHKTYLAVVHGAPPWPDEEDDAPDARLDAPLRVAGVNDPTPLTGVRMLAGPGGLPSLTLVRVLARRAPYALVRCQPVSGRQHQIRVHLAHAGFPIVGDKLYAHGDEIFMAFCDRGITEELARRFVLPRHALHAQTVTLPHPGSGQTLTVESPLPADLRALV